MAVGVECHGGLGGIGIGNTMVIGVVNQERTKAQYQEVCREKGKVPACEKTFEILNTGVVTKIITYKQHWSIE